MARIIVDVMLKPEILDPQGEAIARALPRLGFSGVSAVRQGKRFEVELDGPGRRGRTSDVRKMAETLLANTVIEDFTVTGRGVGRTFHTTVSANPVTPNPASGAAESHGLTTSLNNINGYFAVSPDSWGKPTLGDLRHPGGIRWTWSSRWLCHGMPSAFRWSAGCWATPCARSASPRTACPTSSSRRPRRAPTRYATAVRHRYEVDGRRSATAAASLRIIDRGQGLVTVPRALPADGRRERPGHPDHAGRRGRALLRHHARRGTDRAPAQATRLGRGRMSSTIACSPRLAGPPIDRRLGPPGVA